MKIVNCEILDPTSGDRFQGFLEWEGAVITKVGRGRPGLSRSDVFEDEVLDGRGCLLTSSFVELFADFCEPGYEHREDIGSGSLAAAAGGYTTVCVIPDTQPVCDGGDTAQYIRERARQVGLVEVLPLGATTRDLAGEAMSEIAELAEAGIPALSAAERYERDTGLLRRVFEYAGNFGLRMLLFNEDPSLARGGVANEGLTATRLGLPPIPAAAEEIAVARHIALCALTGVPLHLACLSSAASVRLVREAKQRNLPVTASASALHLLRTDADLAEYDSFLNVRPPLRGEADREALIEALEDGTLDAVVSAHRPRAAHEKAVEFERALPGASGIEFTFSLLNELVQARRLSLLRAVRALTTGPRRAIGLKEGGLKPGMPADLVLLDLTTPWTLTADRIRSRGHNTPFLGQALTGRVVLTVRSGRITFNGWTESER